MVKVSIEELKQPFSERDMEFNRKMVMKGNEASGFVRRNLKVDSLGGKVLRYSPENEKKDKESKDILDVISKDFFGE